MQSLDLIRKRIKSIETTKKITNAMKLVATTKIKSQTNRYKAVSVFCREYYEIFKQLILKQPDLSFLRLRPVTKKKNLYILVSSDLGLCGPYNNNICKHLMEELKPEDDIVVIGQRGASYLKMHGYGKQIVSILSWSLDDDDAYYTLLPVAYQITEKFRNAIYDQIKIVYTEFTTSVSYRTKTWNILPIWPELFGATKEDTTYNFTIYEPNAKEIIASVLPVYVSNTIYGALVESALCETSSRRFAMEGATKNATELIDTLKVQYNQARQEHITQEINEIVAGSIGKK